MKKFACWGGSAVKDTVYIDIGALPINLDSIFLAAHTPVRVEHTIGPSVSADLSGENQVLDALIEDIGTYKSNSVIAVTGAPGTGKSHVVRWVNAQLRDVDKPIHLLYVPREIANLRDLLASLVRGLPGELGDDLLTRVDRAIGSLTEPEVASRLVSQMEQELRWSFGAPPAVAPNESVDDRAKREQLESLLGQYEEDGRRRGGLADILAMPSVREHLERAGGTVRNVAESIVGKIQRGDAAVTQFSAEDLDIKVPARDRLLRQFLSTIRVEEKPALSLLQQSLERALPQFIGLTDPSGETLSTLFSKAREILADSKTELVLLFEDLAQFGLIDSTLFNQFLIQPAKDRAPLRVIFAITNAKWDERVPEAVQRRVRHRFQVLPIQELSDGVGDISGIEIFLARYLNLVRDGRDAITNAWASADVQARRDGTWIPNACSTRNDGKECEFRSECHLSFGAPTPAPLTEVGLYPYNRNALRRLVSRLGDKASNPGHLLKAALEEVLEEARPLILSGDYPDKRVEELFDYVFETSSLSMKAGVDGQAGERMLRTNVIWGGDAVITDQTLLDAFDLPLPQITEPTPVDLGAENGGGGDDAKPVPKEKGTLPYLREINSWSQNPVKITEAVVDQIRTWLWQAVSERLKLDQDFINAQGNGKLILDSAFLRYSFVFPGAEFGRIPGKGILKFEIAPSDEMTELLIALLWYQANGHWNDDGDYKWPQGYRAPQLRRSLEAYLDSCAERVRSSVLERRANYRIRDQVLGVEAIAHRCIDGGLSPVQASVGLWAEVESEARTTLTELNPSQWMTDLYSVRQGESNDPQMVDTPGSVDAVQRALRMPFQFLEQIVLDPETLPEIRVCAKRIRDAIANASADQLALSDTSVSSIQALLSDSGLIEVIGEAKEIGNLARTAQLFRPAAGWADFEKSCSRALENASAWASRDGDSELDGVTDNDRAVLIQTWVRGVIALEKDLAVIHNALLETTEHSNYQAVGGDTASDLRRLDAESARALEYLHCISGGA